MCPERSYWSFSKNVATMYIPQIVLVLPLTVMEEKLRKGEEWAILYTIGTEEGKMGITLLFFYFFVIIQSGNGCCPSHTIFAMIFFLFEKKTLYSFECFILEDKDILNKWSLSSSKGGENNSKSYWVYIEEEPSHHSQSSSFLGRKRY